jgi:hypothetical protein
MQRRVGVVCMSDLAACTVCGIYERAMPQREPNLLLPPWLRGESQQNSRCTASELVTVGVPGSCGIICTLARGAFKARVQMLGPD